jgi:hypothetical protein
MMAPPTTRRLGRLLCQAWSGRYEPHDDPVRADCLVAFSFGVVKDKTTPRPRPGRANEQLARLAFEQFPALPKILQIEVADAYRLLDPLGRVAVCQAVGADPYGRLTTLEVAEQAARFMVQNGWTTPLLLAHPYHLPRVEVVWARLGLPSVVPPGLERVDFVPDSSQWWTRSRTAWRLKEPLVLLLFRLRGWL